MSEDKKIVHTRYGQFHRYDVIEMDSILGGKKWYVHEDGEAHRGPFSTLKDAVDVAEEESE